MEQGIARVKELQDIQALDPVPCPRDTMEAYRETLDGLVSLRLTLELTVPPSDLTPEAADERAREAVPDEGLRLLALVGALLDPRRPMSKRGGLEAGQLAIARVVADIATPHLQAMQVRAGWRRPRGGLTGLKGIGSHLLLVCPDEIGGTGPLRAAPCWPFIYRGNALPRVCAFPPTLCVAGASSCRVAGPGRPRVSTPKVWGCPPRPQTSLRKRDRARSALFMDDAQPDRVAGDATGDGAVQGGAGEEGGEPGDEAAESTEETEAEADAYAKAKDTVGVMLHQSLLVAAYAAEDWDFFDLVGFGSKPRLSQRVGSCAVGAVLGGLPSDPPARPACYVGAMGAASYLTSPAMHA